MKVFLSSTEKPGPKSVSQVSSPIYGKIPEHDVLGNMKNKAVHVAIG
jgi:hypothetical protein